MERLKNRLVSGLFWGDEGKAKIVDYLTEGAYVVVRYQGGANAGHSVEAGGKRYVLHQVPTGILHPGKICILGAGMVIDIKSLVAELAALESLDIDWSGRLKISSRAHLVLPFHKIIEEIQEKKRGIGTTKRGIGPAYRDKAARIGIRMGDLKLGKAHLLNKIHNWLSDVGILYEKAYHVEFPEAAEVADNLAMHFDYFAESVTEVTAFVDEIARTKGGVLVEGAQGTMLSVNWGTYPFVTSSETTSGGASEGIGFNLRLIDEIVGLTKAFCTRVGNGPFPTEGDNDIQSKLRGTGEKSFDEFGSTTGRPRRCGWLDGMALRYASRINGVDSIALTKLDVLTGINPLKIATAYRECEDFPSTIPEVEQVVPIYEEFCGWSDDISTIHKFENLPMEAKVYVHKVEEIAGVPVRYIGVGPARNDIIIR